METFRFYNELVKIKYTRFTYNFLKLLNVAQKSEDRIEARAIIEKNVVSILTYLTRYTYNIYMQDNFFIANISSDNTFFVY